MLGIATCNFRFFFCARPAKNSAKSQDCILNIYKVCFVSRNIHTWCLVITMENSPKIMLYPFFSFAAVRRVCVCFYSQYFFKDLTICSAVVKLQIHSRTVPLNRICFYLLVPNKIGAGRMIHVSPMPFKRKKSISKHIFSHNRVISLSV